jgi:hypothetical protein
VTASRICRACGAELAGVVRWCARCHEPVRELTPREPVWRDGEFVGQPVHTGGAVPHWSRWEGSATTLGPWGRIGLTAALLATLPVAGLFGMFMYVIWFPVIAIVGLGGIWAKGWVIPGASTPADVPASAPRETSSWDRVEILRAALVTAVVLAGVATLLYMPNPVMRFAVIVSGVVVGGAAALRWVRGDR